MPKQDYQALDGTDEESLGTPTQRPLIVTQPSAGASSSKPTKRQQRKKTESDYEIEEDEIEEDEEPDFDDRREFVECPVTSAILAWIVVASRTPEALTDSPRLLKYLRIESFVVFVLGTWFLQIATAWTLLRRDASQETEQDVHLTQAMQISAGLFCCVWGTAYMQDCRNYIAIALTDEFYWNGRHHETLNLSKLVRFPLALGQLLVSSVSFAAGMVLIVHSGSVTEAILNCFAASFVIEIDEYILNLAVAVQNAVCSIDFGSSQDLPGWRMVREIGNEVPAVYVPREPLNRKTKAADLTWMCMIVGFLYPGAVVAKALLTATPMLVAEIFKGHVDGAVDNLKTIRDFSLHSDIFLNKTAMAQVSYNPFDILADAKLAQEQSYMNSTATIMVN